MRTKDQKFKQRKKGLKPQIIRSSATYNNKKLSHITCVIKLVLTVQLFVL